MRLDGPRPRPSRSPRAFTISRGSRTEARVLTVTVEADGVRGRGECVPYARYGETPDSVAAQIEGLPERFDRAALQDLLPPGAARNAVDCALWDLEAKRSGRRVWQLAGLPRAGAGGHRLHAVARHARGDAGAGGAERAPAAPEGQARRRGRHGPARGGARRRAAGADRRRRQRGLDAGGLRRARAGAGRGSASRWSSSRCRPARTTRSPRWRGRCRSAPTRAATTARASPALARQVRHGQHQARQDRRADRGAGAARRGAGGRLRRDGRLHGRLEPRAWRRRCWWRRGRRSPTSTGRCCSARDREHPLVYDERGRASATPELWG